MERNPQAAEGKNPSLAATPNNSFNRSANRGAFIRETPFLLRFVAPG